MSKQVIIGVAETARVLRRGRCLALWALGLPGLSTAGGFECLLEPYQTVELRSAVEGQIRQIHVQRGDDVKAGQTLVELESSAERSAANLARYRSETDGRITASKNRMEYAAKKTDRSQELLSQNFISVQARDEADTERKLAESELKQALEDRELARLEYQRATDIVNLKTLRSPFDGIVVDRMLNPGDLAEAGSGRKPILKLAQIHPLRVEVVLPLATFGKLRPGMTAQVTPETGGQFSARVKVVDRVFDAASGTYGVRLELPNSKGQLPSGIRCKVEFPQLSGFARIGIPSR